MTEINQNSAALHKDVIASIIDSIPGVITVYNRGENSERELIYVSSGLKEIVGPETAKAVDNDPNVYFGLLLPEDAISLEAAAQKAIDEKKPLDHVYRLRADNDQIVWIRARLNWRLLDKSTLRWQGIIFDVTKQVLDKQKLIRNQEHLHSLIEEASDLIWENDLDGNYLSINKSFTNILGYTPDKILGTDSLKIVHPDDKKISSTHFQKALQGEYPSYEVRCISTHNKTLHFWIKLRPIYRDDKMITVHGLARDVTERLKSEQIRDINYRITEQLNDVEDLTNFSEIISEELSKIMNTDNFFLAIYDKQLDRYNFPYYRDVTDEIAPDQFLALQNTITDYVRKQAKPLLLSYTNQDEFQKQNNINFLGEDSPCWIGAPIMDQEKKEAIGVIVVQSYVNINEYDQDDLKALEFVALNMGTLILRKLSEMKQRNVNEQLSLITKILRHDLTNDFVVIKSALKLYNKTNDPMYLSEAEKKISKGIELINQMRDQEDFAAENRNLVPYLLGTVLKRVSSEYTNCKINVSGRGSVFADQSIYSVFHNIISNAISHGGADEVNISIETEERKCIVRVSNNGTKILDDISDKIFTEGFSGSSTSTGMGLYLISKTVENYHGTIFLENNLPNKVSFILIFPKAIDR